MQPLKTRELADWLRISPATVRLWTTEGYGEYLSPAGQGGDGRTRVFDEQDARIIAFINALKNQGQERDEIMRTLAQLQSEAWKDLPPMPIAPHGVVTEVINAETAQNALITQRNALLREISMLEETIERLEGDIQKRESTENELRQELDKRRNEVTLLTGQLEAAKMKADIISSERKSSQYWLQIIAAVVAVVIILSAIAIVYLSNP